MKILVGLVLFLIALIISTFLAKPIYRDHIQRDLTEKVSAILIEHDLDPSGIEVQGHHLTEIGALPAGEAAREELLNDLDGVIGLYVDLDVESAPVLLPPHFRLAEQADDSVILSGVIRDESERSYLVNLAGTPIKAGGKPRTVIDKLELSNEVAAIEPREKLSALTPALFTTAEKAYVNWSPSELEIGGMIDSEGDQEPLVRIAGGLAVEEVAFANKLQVEPYRDLDFGLERKDGVIVVRGLLPNRQTQTSLLNLVKAQAKDTQVIDKTTLAVRSKDAWWAKNPQSFLPSFLSSTEGPAYVHYFSNRFVAKGTFPNKSDYSVAQKRIAKLPKKIKREAKLDFLTNPEPAVAVVPVTPAVIPGAPTLPGTPAEPVAQPEEAKEPAMAVAVVEPATPALPAGDPAEAAGLVQALKPLAVYFNSSSSYIKTTENKKIEEAARLILASKNVTQELTVGGYADLRGNAKYNRSLSLQRANAVRDRLIAKGVPASRLTVNHFGEDTSQTSRKNLWKSRRVEISLAPAAPAAPAAE